MAKRFRADPKVEQEGVWNEYETCRVKLARAGNTNRAYTEAVLKATRKFQHAIKVDMLSSKAQQTLMDEVFARTIVKGWEARDYDKPDDIAPVYIAGKIEIKNGETFELVPYNEENVIKFLSDPGNFDTREAIYRDAQSATAYREIDQDEIKN